LSKMGAMNMVYKDTIGHCHYQYIAPPWDYNACSAQCSGFALWRSLDQRTRHSPAPCPRWHSARRETYTYCCYHLHSPQNRQRQPKHPHRRQMGCGAMLTSVLCDHCSIARESGTLVTCFK
jgi:hypothetical protein